MVVCHVSEEQLWSWIDRNAPELEQHLAQCPRCRALAQEIRSGIKNVADGSMLVPPPLPEKLGNYRIKRLLGEGGQGLVYEAEQAMTRRSVALKVIRGGRFVHQHDVKLFQREVRTLARLKHASIADIYEAGRTEDGQYYYAMEYINGVPLNVHIEDNGLSLKQRLTLFGKVCDGVHYAHQRGVIHRDLKPSNILIDEQGNPRILDFGLARVMDPDATQTTTSLRSDGILGTLAYMSPEQALGDQRTIDTRSDVYSLGAILYELLTGQQPHCLRGVQLPDAIRRICEEPIRKPSGIDRSTSGDIETVVLKALEREPCCRYETAEALAEDVASLAAGKRIVARRPALTYRLRSSLRRHRRGVLLVAVGVLLGVMAVWGGMRTWAQHWHDVRRRVLRTHWTIERGTGDDSAQEGASVVIQWPTLPEARLAAAKARYVVGDLGSACLAVTFNAGRKLHWSHRALHAELRRLRDERDRAEELEREVEAARPDDAESWYLYSLATIDRQKALDRVRRALARDRTHTLAWEWRSYLHLAESDYPNALICARELVRLKPRDATPRLLLAYVFVKAERFKEAVQEFTEVIDLNPEHAELLKAHRYRGQARTALADYGAAFVDLETAYDLGVQRSGWGSPWTFRQRVAPAWIAFGADAADELCGELPRVLATPSFTHAQCVLIKRDQGDVEQAAGLLDQTYKNTDDAWLRTVLDCLAGRISPGDLVAAADSPEQLCEACYYAGEMELAAGNQAAAREWSQQCLDTQLILDPDSWPPDPMSEYVLARWRLNSLPK